MAGEGFLVNMFAAVWAFFLLEGPLRSTRVFRAVPFLVFVHTLPSHFFFTVGALPSVLEPRLGWLVPAPLTRGLALSVLAA